MSLRLLLSPSWLLATHHWWDKKGTNEGKRPRNTSVVMKFRHTGTTICRLCVEPRQRHPTAELYCFSDARRSRVYCVHNLSQVRDFPSAQKLLTAIPGVIGATGLVAVCFGAGTGIAHWCARLIVHCEQKSRLHASIGGVLRIEHKQGVNDPAGRRRACPCRGGFRLYLARWPIK